MISWGKSAQSVYISGKSAQKNTLNSKEYSLLSDLFLILSFLNYVIGESCKGITYAEDRFTTFSVNKSNRMPEVKKWIIQ